MQTLENKYVIAFQVDSVQLSSERFDTVNLKSVLVEGIGRKNPERNNTSMIGLHQAPIEPYQVIGVSEDCKILRKSERTGHPILHSVHYAFSNHLQLTLTPDIIWQAILQGISQHISQNSESYRHLFVNHSDKKTLSVFRGDLSLCDLSKVGEETQSIVKDFLSLIKDNVTPAYFNVLNANFSTTTEIEKTAAGITCMEAFSPYFGYHMYCGCGFPEIRLAGTIEDWRVLDSKINEIEELFYINDQINLTWWTSKLKQITQNFLLAAQGKPDISWFKKMYKQIDVYLNHHFNGWIGWLWPYTKNSEKWNPETRTWVKPEKEWGKNPMLNDISDKIEIEDKYIRSFSLDLSKSSYEKTFTFDEENRYVQVGMNGYKGGCFMRTDQFPLGLSKADLKITDVAANKTIDTILIGGFIGVKQEEDGGLMPLVGYGLLI